MKQRTLKSLGSVTLCMILALVSLTAGATMTATIDRNQMTEFEVLTLTVRVSGDGVDRPDFDPIERDFEIINTQTRQSSSFSFVNGRQTSTVYTDYILSLRARRLGELTIPALYLGAARTQPIRIQVVETSAGTSRQNRLVFFDTSVDTPETYVQGQIIYSVKLLYADSVSGDFPPPPSIENAVVETIESEKRYETTVDNRRYYVLEKQYAIFPQRSGTLTIPREAFIGTRGRGGLFSSRQRVNAVSKPIDVSVLPAPAGFSGQQWIAARNLELTEEWSATPVLKVGEPINRMIRLTASGVASSQLPPLPDLTPDTAKIYADPPELTEFVNENGIVSVASTTVGIVPISEGELRLPEIRIPWWNTVTNREEIALIPARTIQVLPAASGATLNPPVPTSEGNSSIPVVAGSGVWSWVSLVLAIALAGSLLLWWRTWTHLQSLRNDETMASPRTDLHPDEPGIFGRLESACKNGNAAAALHALRLWAQHRDGAFNSLRQWAAGKDTTGLLAEIEEAEQQQYARDSHGDWQGSDLLAYCRELRRGEPGKRREASALAPLNPA